MDIPTFQHLLDFFPSYLHAAVAPIIRPIPICWPFGDGVADYIATVVQCAYTHVLR